MVSKTHCSKKGNSFKMIGWSFHGWFPEHNGPNDFMIQEQWLLVAGLNDRLSFHGFQNTLLKEGKFIQEDWLEFPWFPEHTAQRREVDSRRLVGVSMVSRRQCTKNRSSFKKIGWSFHGFQKTMLKEEKLIQEDWLEFPCFPEDNAQRREAHSRRLVGVSIFSRRQCSKKRSSFKKIGWSFHVFQKTMPQMTLGFKNNGCLWLGGPGAWGKNPKP